MFMFTTPKITSVGMDESDCNIDDTKSDNKAKIRDKRDDNTYQVYWRRWIVLVLFSLLALLIQIVWITFAPISVLIQQYYGVSAFTANTLSMSWMISFVIFAPFSTWLFVRLGFRPCVLIGAALLVASCLVRWVGSGQSHFWILWSGQCLASFAQLFTLGSPPLLSARWFGDNERTLATTIGSQSGALGIAVGFVITPYFVHDSSQIWSFMLYEFIGSVVIFILVLFFLGNSPPSPPSPSAAEVEATEAAGEPFWPTTKALMKNRPFVLLLISYGVIVGSFWAIGTVLAQALDPHGYSAQFSGYLGGIMSVAGIISSLAAGPIVDKFRCYKLAIITTCVMNVAAFAWTIVSMVPNNGLMLVFSVGSMGFFLTVMIPVGMETGAELTFPINEAHSGNLLMILANFMSAVLVIGMDVARTGQATMQDSLYFAIGLSGLACLTSFFIPRRYLRLNFEKEVAEKEKNDLETGNVGQEREDLGVENIEDEDEEHRVYQKTEREMEIVVGDKQRSIQ